MTREIIELIFIELGPVSFPLAIIIILSLIKFKSESLLVFLLDGIFKSSDLKSLDERLHEMSSKYLSYERKLRHFSRQLKLIKKEVYEINKKFDVIKARLSKICETRKES